MEESRGAKAANDSHFSRRRRWRLEYLAGNGCVVFPRLLGWVSTIVNGPTQHRRGRLDTAFSYEKAYETILTLTLTKQALRDLERGEALAGAGAQLLGEGFVRLRPALERHHGADGLNPLLVRQRYHRDLRDGLVVVRDVLDLAPR